MKRKQSRKNPSYYLFTTVALAAVLLIWGNVWGCITQRMDKSATPANIACDSISGDGVSIGEATELGDYASAYELPAEIEGKDETVLHKDSYTVSYNKETLCPNYVAWRLTKDRVEGKVRRKDNFHGDEEIDEGFRVEKSDYNNSGFDRGHICPAGDNKHSDVAMDESFLMTNICPQNRSLNAGDWKELEELCRSWVVDYGDVYIAAGPIFDDVRPEKIGKRKQVKISVPSRFFKVVLMMGRAPKAIGFVFPNKKTNEDIRVYAVSVDDVEAMTGIDFFHNLPDEIENKVEAQCRPADFNI